MQDTFEGGITNGNAWYPVHGGAQDWLYVAGGTLHVTLELAEKKWPEGPALRAVWDATRDSLLRYPLRATLGGVWGRAVAGTAAVRVSVPSGGLAFPADPQTGMFYRALAPGEHRLVFAAEGRQAVERDVTVPEDGSGVEVNVDLGASAAAAPPLPLPPTRPFPYAIIAGRDVLSEQLRAYGKSLEEAPSESVAAAPGKVWSGFAFRSNVTQGEPVATSAGPPPRMLLWRVGRWALFLGGMAWIAWHASRSGLWARSRLRTSLWGARRSAHSAQV